MRNYLIIIIINVVLVLVESSFFMTIFGTSINPHLILSYSFALSLKDQENMALFSALIGGIFYDFVNIKIVGVQSVFLTVSIYIAYIIKKYIFKSFILQIVLIFIFSYVHYLVISKSYYTFNPDFIFGSALNVLSVFVFYLLNNYLKDRAVKSEYKLNE